MQKISLSIFLNLQVSIYAIPLLTYILRNNVQAASGVTLGSNIIDEKKETIVVNNSKFPYQIGDGKTQMALDTEYIFQKTKKCDLKVLKLYLTPLGDSKSGKINIKKSKNISKDYSMHEITFTKENSIKRISIKIPLFENKIPLMHQFLFENMLYSKNTKENFILEDLFYEINYMLRVLFINANCRDSFILFSKIINMCLEQIVIDNENDKEKFETISNSFKNFFNDYINCLIFDTEGKFDILEAYYKLELIICSFRKDMLTFETNLLYEKKNFKSLILEQSKLALICQNFINISTTHSIEHQKYINAKEKIGQIENRINVLEAEMVQIKDLQTAIITARTNYVVIRKATLKKRLYEIESEMKADTTKKNLLENNINIASNTEMTEKTNCMETNLESEYDKLNEFEKEMTSRRLNLDKALEAYQNKFNAMPFIYENAENVCDILGIHKYKENIFLFIKEGGNTPVIVTRLFNHNSNDFIDFDNYDSKLFVVEITKIIETILINMDKKENIKILANLTNAYLNKFITLYDNYNSDPKKKHLLKDKKDILTIITELIDHALSKLAFEQEHRNIIIYVIYMKKLIRKFVIGKNINESYDNIKLLDEYHKLCIFLNSYLYPGVNEIVTVENNVFKQNFGFDVNTCIVALIVNIVQDVKKINGVKSNSFFVNFKREDLNNIEFCVFHDENFIITSEFKKTYYYEKIIKDKTINPKGVESTRDYFEQFKFEIIQFIDTIVINYQENGIVIAKKLCRLYKKFLSATKKSIINNNIEQEKLMIPKIDYAITVIQNIIDATPENFKNTIKQILNVCQSDTFIKLLTIENANEKNLNSIIIDNEHEINTEIYEGSSIIFYMLRKGVDVKLSYFSSSKKVLLQSEIPIFTQQKAHFITLQLFEMLVLNIFNTQKTNKLLQEVHIFYITVKNRIKNQKINNVEKEKITMMLENSAKVIQSAINELKIENKLIESVDKRENVLNIINNYLNTLENSLNNSQEYLPLKNSYTHLLGLIIKWRQYLQETFKKNDWKLEFKIDLYKRIQADIDNYYILTQENDMKLREFVRYASNNTKRNEQQQIDTAGSSNLSYDDNDIFSLETISDNDLEHNLKMSVDELVRKVNSINKTNNKHYPPKSDVNTTLINIENMKKNNKIKFEEQLTHLSQQFENDNKKILENEANRILQQFETKNKKKIEAELQLLRQQFENTNNSLFGAGSNQFNNISEFEKELQRLRQQFETNNKKILEDEAKRIFTKLETKNKITIEAELQLLRQQFENTNNSSFGAGSNQFNNISEFEKELQRLRQQFETSNKKILEDEANRIFTQFEIDNKKIMEAELQLIRQHFGNTSNSSFGAGSNQFNNRSEFEKELQRLRQQFETSNKKILEDEANRIFTQLKTDNKKIIEAELQLIRQHFGNTYNSLIGAGSNQYNIKHLRSNINNTIKTELKLLREQFGSNFATNSRYLFEFNLIMKKNGYVLCHGIYSKTEVYTCYI